MTAPDLLAATVRWCAGLSAVVAELAPRVARLAEDVDRDWSDGHGQEWVERTALVHRELGRSAVTAAELGSAITRAVADAAVADPWPDPAVGPWPGPTTGVPHRLGPRLGSTDADRADDDRGMVIPQLPEPDG